MLYTLPKPTRILPSFASSLKAALAQQRLSHDQIVSLVQTTNRTEIDALHNAADSVTRKVFGDYVSIRGIIEFSNICEKRCDYCGVPTYDQKFLINQDVILRCCDFMYAEGYRNVVLQSGEVSTNERINWVLELVHKIKSKFGFEQDKGMCIVLSIGELSRQQYQKLFDAGANRYLLRIESSDPQLYSSMHPKTNHSFQRRLQALHDLKDIGYVTGTGVMVGVPNQTYDNLAQDIEFFRDEGYHMIGLGPYLVHNDTIMGKRILNTTTREERKEADLLKADITLNMYDTIRLLCPYVNIAATTALETLSPGYKKRALTGGANVLMPIITPKEFRDGYQIYEGKKEVNMDHIETHQMMLELMNAINKKPMFTKWNNPPLYTMRNNPATSH
mgnify:CR=1 FL=1